MPIAPLTNRDLSKIPAISHAVIALIEKSGFPQWEYILDYPVPDSIDDRVQTREQDHVAPKEQVDTYAAAMQNKDQFPAPIVTLDNYIIDGITRFAAMRKNKLGYTHAIVIQERYRSASRTMHDKFLVLGAKANRANGRNLTSEELERAILAHSRIGHDISNLKIATTFNVSPNKVTSVLQEEGSRKRLIALGENNPRMREAPDTLTKPELKILHAKGHMLNDGPFTGVVELLMDAGIRASDLVELLSDLQKQRSDKAQLQLLDERRKSLQPRISEYRFSGRKGSSISSGLRRQLQILTGYIASKDLSEFTEPDAQLRQETIDKLQAGIVSINNVLRAFGVRTDR